MPSSSKSKLKRRGEKKKRDKFTKKVVKRNLYLQYYLFNVGGVSYVKVCQN